MQRRTAITILTAATLLVGGCAADGTGGAQTTGGDQATTAGDATGGSGELTPVTVGVLPIVDTAAAWLGVDEGIFADHGLDVTLEVAAGGAAVVPSVVSGDYQFGFSNALSPLQAGGQGLPLLIVAPGVATTGSTEADNGAILAAPDADLTRPADLNDATVAVNALNSIGTTLVSYVVDQDGGDSSTIDFVEMGFPEMPAALASGNVDAAWIFEPFITIASGQGATLVSNLLVEVDPELMLSVYFTSTGYAEQNPDVVDAFVAAMTESLAYAEENPDKTRAILSTYTEIPADLREQITLPRFPSELNVGSLDLLAGLALDYGLVDDPIDVESMVR